MWGWKLPNSPVVLPLSKEQKFQACNEQSRITYHVSRSRFALFCKIGDSNLRVGPTIRWFPRR